VPERSICHVHTVTFSDAGIQITRSDGASETGSASPTAAYGVGSHTVNCSTPIAVDDIGGPIALVTCTPPVLIVPGDRTVHVTSAAGCAGTYFTRLASATDIADPHPEEKAPELGSG
jgi:hypothetical protein